ncbi:DUF6482 family protein [Pseudomonas typographi]|uniref:DUF6482 family protein n=1 Tax=Pseudomonas typographi TaxID=2715964 RepID=UPI0016831CF7|nr:DUF6482 family protein [Pseudomonas typographi]MBD1554487.1 cation transporter [Pseudomonas typographi]
MDLKALAARIKAGEVAALELTSVEGGSYVLHAELGSQLEPVLNAQRQPLHVASVEEARKVLFDVPEVPFFLVQRAAHDEMVGQDDTHTGAAREPIKLRSSL